MTLVGGTSIGYIATGNINAIGTNTMTYNKANRMATATVSSTTSTYTYDAFGNRLKAVVGSGTPSVYEYDLDDDLITETNSGVETDYVYLDPGPASVTGLTFIVINAAFNVCFTSFYLAQRLMDGLADAP